MKKCDDIVLLGDFDSLLQIYFMCKIFNFVSFSTVTTTPFPTPAPLLQYQVATWSLFGVAIVTVVIIAALGITLWRKTKTEDDYMR